MYIVYVPRVGHERGNGNFFFVLQCVQLNEIMASFFCHFLIFLSDLAWLSLLYEVCTVHTMYMQYIHHKKTNVRYGWIAIACNHATVAYVRACVVKGVGVNNRNQEAPP